MFKLRHEFAHRQLAAEIAMMLPDILPHAVVKRMNSFNWKLLLLGILVLCPALSAIWYWQRIVEPPRLTRLHSQELAPVIATFEATEGSLEVQLQPEKILTVATREYLLVFERINTALHCPNCDQFWVATSAEAKDVCVFEYSSSKSKVRATVIETGYRADAATYESLKSGLSRQARYTYSLIKEEGTWKISQITDYTPAAKGQADLLEVLNEEWVEIGCQ